MFEYIKSDLYRYYGNAKLVSWLKAFAMNKSFKYCFWLRLCQMGGIWKLIALPIHALKSRGNIYIHYKTKIGYGLYIGHGGPVIVNPTTIIGNNCNLSQFTTIGSNEGVAATIGDNVTIGAGSVVTKDVPSNATVAGNYAKVLNYNNPGRYIANRWENEISCL